MGGVLLSMVNDVAAAHQVDSLEQLLHHHAPFGFPRTNIPPGYLNALDLDSISAQSSHRYFIDHCRWMRPAQRRGGERRVGHGLHELLLRNRHQQRNRSRTSERWINRFHEFFERNNRFPYAEVVAEWRTTVRSYEQHSAHHRPGDVLARGREDFLHRRYHHLMPHRRSDDVHDEGDVRDGERRWCEVFARAWEVLVYQPLGSTFHVPTEDGQSLVFEHAGLQATVRTPLERNFFMRVAKLLGYVNDESEERTLFTFVAITRVQTLDCASRNCFKMHRSVSACEVRRLAGGTTSTSSHHRSRSLISAGSFTLTTGTPLDPEA